MKIVKFGFMLSLFIFIVGGCSDEQETFYGVLEAEKVTIYSQVEGEVYTIEKEEQEEIKKNDVLGKIDGTYYELKRKEAEATVTLAETKKKLAEENGVSDNELKMIEAEITQAKAIYEQAKYIKSKTDITASQDGIISEWLINEGDFVKAGTPLVIILTHKPLEFTVYVPQTSLQHFQDNKEVLIQSVSYPNDTFKGKIVRIGDEAVFSPQNNETLKEQVEKVFPITIQVIEDKENKLKPGMDVTISF